MAGLRDIRRRIRAVKNTQQITRAMEMVAAAKLRRSQERVLAARPYARKAEEVLARLGESGFEIDHPLTEEREVHRIGYAVITADRGLCGSYNVNVIRKASIAMASAPAEVRLVAVGRKGRDYYRRRGHSFMKEFTGIGDDPGFTQAKTIARTLIGLYLDGEVDQVRLIYTEFISALQQRPVESMLLPISRRFEARKAREGLVDYFYEPSAGEVLDALLPKYVEIQLYRALLESKASEHGARMTAMRSATDNAEEMIDKLTLDYNRARQAAITKEISEIVRGAEALKG